jgi:hypothetical protein
MSARAARERFSIARHGGATVAQQGHRAATRTANQLTTRRFLVVTPSPCSRSTMPMPRIEIAIVIAEAR